MRSFLAGWLLLAGLLPLAAHAADFEPDPRSVQRCGPAYRFPQAGWTVLHIEGEPYERGVQHGRLLAPEIAAEVRCLAINANSKSPADGWKQARTIVNALFLRGYTREQLEEMKGIADGASASGARFDGRPIDVLDIAVINAPNELDALDAALQATPTGLEGLALTPDQSIPAPPAIRPVTPDAAQRADPAAPENFSELAHPALATSQRIAAESALAAQPRRQRPMRCSAFAATGPATKDGKIVFGHVTMWKLYPAHFYNIWLDIKPQRGHRFVMQTYPGGMHSGMDYAINDAGMLMCETTLEQTRFDRQGVPLAARIRAATQYADSIDKIVEMLSQDNNGLSTEEWILGDLKTNEIAMLTLGTRHSKLRRSGKQEWIADAKGFYWSCNNDKDRDVRLETIAAMDGRSSPVGVFSPSKRDIAWLAMFDQRRGKIDADYARHMLNTPALVTAYSVDAKVTTADLAGQLKTWASFGPPSGQIWNPTDSERARFPDVRPLVCNPWVVLHAGAPKTSAADDVPVADVRDCHETEIPTATKNEPEPPAATAWHGTLLPKADADIWLTTAFANYERIVAQEHALRAKAKHHELSDADRDALAVSLFYYRSTYELGARAGEDAPLTKTHADFRSDLWHKVAAGKGVLLLHSLRGLIGAAEFDRLMDEFGRAHAGQEVTAAQFQSHVEKATKKSWADFFDRWLNKPGLARLDLVKCETRRAGDKWITSATVRRDKDGPNLTTMVTVETSSTEVSETAVLDQAQRIVEVTTNERPERVVVDKHGLAARGGGGPFTILTCEGELDKSLIVYGTLDEEFANRESARLLQAALRNRDQAITVNFKKDSEVTADELKQRHLVLIGRPDTNSLVARFRDALPVSFGSHSFVVRDEAYAHPDSAVFMAAENPLNKRFSLVVIAGLSGRATVHAAPQFDGEALPYAEVILLPHGEVEHGIVVAPKSLIREVAPE